MQARMKNPAAVVPGAMEAIQALLASTYAGGIPPATLHLVHLRASQINGCHLCVESGKCYAQQAGESDDRLLSVVGWRKASCFTDAERAALALTEAVTLLTDGFVPDEVYDRAAAHFDAPRLAHLIGLIVAINSWNRMMVSRRIPPGGHTP